MGSSVPDAIDYLMTHVPTLAGLLAVDPKPVVEDTWPVERGRTMVIIGGGPDPDSYGVDQRFDGQAGRETENVTVHSTIVVYRTGERMASKARRDAYAILDAIGALIADDRSLGRAIDQGLPARIGSSRGMPTSNAKAAGTGRICEVRFDLTWQHRTT